MQRRRGEETGGATWSQSPDVCESLYELHDAAATAQGWQASLLNFFCWNRDRREARCRRSRSRIGSRRGVVLSWEISGRQKYVDSQWANASTARGRTKAALDSREARTRGETSQERSRMRGETADGLLGFTSVQGGRGGRLGARRGPRRQNGAIRSQEQSKYSLIVRVVLTMLGAISRDVHSEHACTSIAAAIAPALFARVEREDGPGELEVGKAVAGRSREAGKRSGREAVPTATLVRVQLCSGVRTTKESEGCSLRGSEVSSLDIPHSRPSRSTAKGGETMSLSTPRQRGPPSTHSTPASNRPPPRLAFSPLSQTGSVRSVSAQSVPSYQPSVASSSFPNTQATRYLSNASVAPSNLGSVATTANPGSARFRRGHARNKANAHPPAGVSSINPDLVDLLALEEPDVVFRMFGVRDVRKLEQRASDAANAKVAELRTMVGERYRDLLAAADSIVRMRSAADKLLDRLVGVESAVISAGDAIQDNLTQRRPSLITHPSDPANPRTLANPPTLSLTLHLFLNLSSLVHSFIEQSKFLPAARFENLGRVVWRELEGFVPEAQADEETTRAEGPPKSIKAAFPIIVKHHEGMDQLGPLIVRRATAELRAPSLPPAAVAQILASLILLDHASLTSSLSIFLRARTQALSSLLASPRASTSKHTASLTDSATVQIKVEKALDCILKTIEAVNSVFTDETPLLPHFLKEIEHPTAAPSSSPTLTTSSDAPPGLQPILTTLPNYPTLARHLPNSILSYNPFLSSSTTTLSKDAVASPLSTWFEASASSLLTGVDEWITSLVSTEHPALALSAFRDAIVHQLSSSPLSSSTEARTLQARLGELIESRLNQVYALNLSLLVNNLEPSLRSLLSKLCNADEREDDLVAQDRESARFLFSIETPSQFVQTPFNKFGATSAGSITATVDPFSSFLAKVGKRVDGRTPLIDLGLEELEKGAHQIREDLRSWLSDGTSLEAEGARGLRARYVAEVGTTLEGIVRVLEKVLADEETNDERGIGNALFVGTFAKHLSISRTFTRDLFLGVPPASKNVLETWQSRLSALQERTLRLWQQDAVRRAISILRKGANDKALVARNSPNVPSAPSTFLVQALNSLLRSLHTLPLHRLHSNPAPATSLLQAFSTEAIEVASELLGVLRTLDGGDETKRRLAWDVALLGLIADESERKKWQVLETKTAQLLPSNGSMREEISQSATNYLLRTQSIYAPFFPSPVPLPLAAASDPKLHRSPARLLPLGPPPAAVQGDFKSLLAVALPGPRLGLLPTKG